MTRLYLAIVLATEMAAIGLVSYHYSSVFVALLLAPVPLLTLFAALFMGRRMRSLAYRVRRLSPEDIIRIAARVEERTAGPE